MRLDRVEVKVPGVTVYRVDRDDLPSHQYIVVCPEVFEIHLKPWVCGRELHDLTCSALRKMLRVAYELTPLNKARYDEVCELVILAGGFYYMLEQAFKDLFGETIQRCFIGAKRRFTGEEWVADVSYVNLEALPDDALVLIGDTIATGCTLEAVLTRLRQEALRMGRRVRCLVIFTLAGAIPGFRRLRKIEEAYRATWPGFEMHVFAAQALFGLAPNGTDMPYGHPDTVAPPEVIDKVREVYTDFMMRNLCAIFDWGDRTKNPRKHLREIVEICRRLRERAPDEESAARLEEIARRAEARLRALEQRLKASDF